MPHFAREGMPTILLVDNGSLEAAATLSLRQIAISLGSVLDRLVEPVSLLHSSKIPADQLGGQAAETLEPALERRLHAGISDFLVVPLFFGPSLALTEYLPGRVALLRGKFPRLQVRLAPPLVDIVDPADSRMAVILGDQVRAVLPAGGEPPAVILVDHGSPVPGVTQVRDRLAAQLQQELGGVVRAVQPASMERRPGAEFSFNEPLLERAFEREGFQSGRVIVSLLFLSPGRHAGPGGDIAKICMAAEKRHPGLQTVTTGLVGSHPGLIPILVDRFRAGLSRPPL
jgi:sirohydrochlorin ferrochelatase